MQAGSCRWRTYDMSSLPRVKLPLSTVHGRAVRTANSIYMISSATSNSILASLSESHLSGAPLRRLAMELLGELDDYNWSGVYRLEEDTLVLDEYVGAHTDHDRIPVGRGVCGTAVAEDKNQVIDDVRELSNYLSCSVNTRSEIVVLIKKGDSILGQIDIDGHRVGAFGGQDEAFLESIAAILADRW
jgi:L-methionine (R)-S-oxide reductase